jgi:DNA-binding MarR family transcriptional regulator
VRHYTKATFNVTESVGFQLVRARNLIVAEMDGALKDFDISSQQMAILLMLRRKLATTPLEMSKMLGMDTGLMTRMLDKLEAKGLLVRSRDRQDRRVVNLSLTKDGTAVADQVPEVAVEVLNARLKAFTKDEVAELRRLLRKFAGD